MGTKLPEGAVILSVIMLGQRLSGYENKPLGYLIVIIGAVAAIFWLHSAYKHLANKEGVHPQVGKLRIAATWISALVLVGFVVYPWITATRRTTNQPKTPQTSQAAQAQPAQSQATTPTSVPKRTKTTARVETKPPLPKGFAPSGGPSVGTITQTQAPCAGGIAVGGGTANGGNCGPPPMVLTVASVETDVYTHASFLERPGFHKTEITIVPNQPVVAPCTIALEFDNPISDIGHTVKNVGALLGGGPFRRGIHARETVSTNFGPEHPLVVVVYSLLPVKLLGMPTIEY